MRPKRRIILLNRDGVSFSLSLASYTLAPEDVSNKVLPQKILVCCVLSWLVVRMRIRVGAEIRDEKKSGTKKYKKTRDRRKEDPSFQNQNCGSR